MGIFKKSSLPPYHPAKKPPYPGALSSDGIRGVYSNCFDLGGLPLYLGGDPAVRAQLFFIDGLIATADVSLALIAPLTDALRLGAPRRGAAGTGCAPSCWRQGGPPRPSPPAPRCPT